MDLVTGPLGSLASKLLQLLQDKYQLQRDVKDNVQWLSGELESIGAFLRHVGAVPWDKLDEGVKVWARQVREASYDMEDVVDTCLIRGVLPQAGAAGDQNMFKRLMECRMFDLTKEVKARYDVAGSIERMKKQVQEIAERRARYKDLFVDTHEAPEGFDPRLSALYTQASKLVGIEEPRDALIEMLSVVRDDGVPENGMRIVSIAGLAGLGKTTLAKAVYDRINYQFDCAAFVAVGQKPDPRKILRDILIELSNDRADRRARGVRGQEMEPQVPEKTYLPKVISRNRTTGSSSIMNSVNSLNTQRARSRGPNLLAQVSKKTYTTADLMELDDMKLINEVRLFLEAERYFIVLDDIWETSIWDYIKIAFIDNEGSRIMTTTRNSQVSMEIGDDYKMKQLSDDNSRKLFYSRISGEKEKCSRSEEVAEITDKIIQKLDGVPLSIVTIASLLDTKPVEDWSKVYNSIGFEHENNKVVGMMKILSFSYYDLRSCLRPCLLYLSMFPEDTYISKKDLILKWMAEGLIEKGKHRCFLDTGDSYFNELISRNMIIPVEEERSGIISGCRVHDIVLRLTRDFSVEENFADVLDSEQQSNAQGNVRRLALQMVNLQSFEMGEKPEVCYKDMSRVRSLNAILCETNMIPSVSSFHVLRVLDLKFCFRMENIQLDHIEKLLHLRYLELLVVTHNRRVKLPKKIGHLKFLQTLILRDTGIQELPKSVGLLTQLLCLRTDENTRVPNCIGKLTSLVELEVHYRPGQKLSTRMFLKELGNLRNLKILSTTIYLRDKRQGRDLLHALSNLLNLHDITIHLPLGGAFIDMKDVNMGQSFTLSSGLRILHLSNLNFPRLPEWINAQNLPNICELTVGVFNLEEQDLAILGRFQVLRGLRLMIIKEHRLRLPVCGSGGFPNLRFLDFSVPIQFVPGAMPWLQHINFSVPLVNLNSANIGHDFGLENLSSLRSVNASIDCTYASLTEVEEAEATLKHALDVHPNRPTLELTRDDEDKMGPVDAPIRILLREFYKWKQDKES